MKKINVESIRAYYRVLHKIYFSLFLVFFGAAFFNLVFVRSIGSVVKLHLLLLLPAYFYLLRRKIQNLFLFILTHLCGGVLCLVYIFPTMDEIGLVIGVILTVIFILVSFAYKNKEREGSVLYAEWLVILLLLAVAYMGSSTESINAAELVQPYTIGAALVVTLLFFIGLHMENMDTTIHNVNDMIAHPIQKIRRFNSRILWIFLGITSGLVTLSLVLHAENLIYALGRFLLAAIRWFFSFFHGDDTPPEEIEEVVQEFVEEGNQGGMMLPQGESGLFWKILEFIAVAAFIVGMIAVIGYGIYRFYRWFYSRKDHKVVVDQYEEISDYTEKSEYVPESQKPTSLLDRIFLDNRGKVRRAYRKKVEKQVKEGKMLLSDTPGSILKESKDLQTQQLVRIYEKARYTEKEITKEDVRAVT